MPRDLVSEKIHRKEIRRQPRRLFERRKGGGSGKHKNSGPGNDPLPAPGSRDRQVQPRRGPKKFKFKRDVMAKGRSPW